MIDAWQGRVQRVVEGPGGAVRAVLLLFTLLVFCNACPGNPFRPVNVDDAPGTDMAAYARKLREPFADVATSKTDTTHGSKLNYRLTVPLVCKPLGIDLAGLRWAGLALALASIALVRGFIERQTGDRVAAFWWTLAFCAVPASGRFFLDLHPFDRFAIFFGIAALTSVHAWIVGLAVFAGAWTDERCLVASIWVLAMNLALSRNRNACAVLVAWTAYAVTRWLVWNATHLTVATGGVHTKLLVPHIGNIPVGTYLSLETGWFLLAAMLATLAADRGQRLLAVVLGGIVLAGIVSCACVIDLTRSLNHFWIALPAVLAIVITRQPAIWTPQRVRLAGLAFALTALLLPSTECYLSGSPATTDGTGGRYVLLGMFKPLPVRLVAWILGVEPG